MLKNLKNEQKGFTIIEVMIVLVIAAVILLIVFLAVPALQRNSRNTQAKNEASALTAAAAEYISNKGGTVPTAASNSGTALSAAEAMFKLANTKNFTSLQVDLAAGTTAVTQVQPVLRLGSKCNNAVNPVTSQAGTARQIALLYMIENQSGTLVTCIDSGV